MYFMSYFFIRYFKEGLASSTTDCKGYLQGYPNGELGTKPRPKTNEVHYI